MFHSALQEYHDILVECQSKSYIKFSVGLFLWDGGSIHYSIRSTVLQYSYAGFIIQIREVACYLGHPVNDSYALS
jgi:hypothetical protein